MLYGRLVQVAETFNRFADFGAANCTKNAFGSRTGPDPPRELQRSPDPLVVIKGREGRGRGWREAKAGRGEREGGVRGRAMDECFVALFRGPVPLISSCVGSTKCPVKRRR